MALSGEVNCLEVNHEWIQSVQLKCGEAAISGTNRGQGWHFFWKNNRPYLVILDNSLKESLVSIESSNYWNLCNDEHD